MKVNAKLKSVGKRIWAKMPLLIMCGGIVGGSYWALWDHYVTMAHSIESDVIYKIESKLLDFKFKMRGPQKPSGEIGILAIDEKAVTRFGDWPFSRKFYDRSLRRLKQIGVKFVGFDATFTDQQITRLDDVKSILRSAKQDMVFGRSRSAMSRMNSIDRWYDVSPGDLDFAKAIGDVDNVILGFFTFKSPGEALFNLGEDKSKYFVDLDKLEVSGLDTDIPEGYTLDSFSPRLRKAYGLKSNYPRLNMAGSHFAFFGNDADDDAINRWITLVENVNGTLMPSLGLKVAAEHLNSDVAVFFNEIGVEAISLFNRDEEADAIEVKTDPFGAGRLLVNHRGPSRAFTHYSLADAYYGTFSKKELKELKGMSLLLGGTASGTQDMRPNVYDPSIDGVENHAAAADNIIRGDFMKRTLSLASVEWKLVVILGLVFAPLVIWGSSLISGLAVVLFLAGYWAFDWYYWFSEGHWAYIAVPSFEIITMFVTTTFYKYVTEEREKKAVKGAFQHYLSPDVIDQVLDNPDALALGGERKEVTVFFSDVRGFTTISENLSPEKLCEFMNDYFTPMTSIVLDSAGTLDKYIGDAIMAFWGAPIAIPDHAAKAAKASIDMMFALDILQRDMPLKGFPKPEIGIGLNTGSASIGNMGSAARFSYTAMGDSINLGARLEGLTKEYSIKIMISEFTAACLDRNDFFFRDLDDIKVKGKNEPVKVFDLIRPDYLQSADDINNLIGYFELGRKAYRDQDWVAAKKNFDECLALRPDDGPALLYRKRLDEYAANAPGDQWDGVYTFTHK